jgi:hypothetical protein
MQLGQTTSTRVFINCLALLAALGACAQQDAEPSPNDAAAPGQEVGTVPDLGGAEAVALPADDECLGPSLTVEEAQALCQWGTSVLGPAGTVFKAACLDVVVDAGAPYPDRSSRMVDMVVKSQASCIAGMQDPAWSPCSYTVGQFKYGVDQFHLGNCGAGAGLILAGYLTK